MHKIFRYFSICLVVILASAGATGALIKNTDPCSGMVAAPVSEAAAELAFTQGFKPETAANIGKITGATSGLLTNDVNSASDSAITAIDNNFLPMAAQIVRSCAMNPACASLVRDGMAVATAAAMTIYKGTNPNTEGFDIADVKNKLPGFTPETSEASVVTTPAHQEGIKTFVTPIYEQDQSEYLEGFTAAPDWLRNGWLVLNNDDFQEISNKDINMKFGGGIKEQGMPWEDYLAKQLSDNTRLPAGFKTFDFFDRATRVATSVKTMDTLTISKLDKPEQIYATLKRYIDKTLDFERSRDGRLTDAMIESKKIELAIPINTTAEQYKQIEKAREYAKDNGVELNTTRVK